MFSLEGSLRLTTIFIHYQDGKLTLLLVYGRSYQLAQLFEMDLEKLQHFLMSIEV
jgi:hypothetical protein